MDYDLTRLGAQNFEEMCRAIFHKELGCPVEHFGDGPDGGREATYEGAIEKLTGLQGAPWDGYVVLQAKFLRRLRGASQDRDWLIRQVRSELRDWANPALKRRKEGKLPDYLVIATNVVLSSAVNGGIDALNAALTELAPKAGIRGFLVWHHNTLCSILDDASEIRRAYRGLITAGDVLSKLLDDLEGTAAANLGGTLRLYTAQSTLKDRFVRLAESGGSSRLTLEEVGVDLPILRTAQEQPATPINAIAELIRIGDHVLRHDLNPSEPSKVVLMGGPGQGKTTLTNLLAQTYRVAMLMDEPDAHGPLVTPVLADTVEMMKDQLIPIPRNKRWPIRINLATLAEEAKGRQGGLLMRIADMITASSGTKLKQQDMKSWFRQYPWLLILDGYDEVASAEAREWIQTETTDLFVLADTVTSDLFTIITTRPQGYEDDFATAGAEHMTLRHLSTPQALAFAERFADKHFGQDVTERDRVLKRVSAASLDPQTSRLMVSPLQVTILTLLLEGRERAPHGRYRLFDAYFETIYKREMNKPGEVGQLLETYQRDIEYLHERVGLELQIAGESAESSDAVISQEGLHALALERLVDGQGHDPKAAAEIAASLVGKATARLVLLVPEKDGVGFEVRSLQEYMAARAITQGSDEHVRARLEICCSLGALAQRLATGCGTCPGHQRVSTKRHRCPAWGTRLRPDRETHWSGA